MNLREHRVFMRELTARARLNVDLETINAEPDGVVRTDASPITIRVAIEIKNVGEKAAGETVINVILPRDLRWVDWCDAEGSDKDFGSLNPAPEEILTASDGREFEAQYLDHRIARISRRPVYRRYFKFSAGPPADGISITPIRVTVQADELPDDIDEYSINYEVRVGRP